MAATPTPAANGNTKNSTVTSIEYYIKNNPTFAQAILSREEDNLKAQGVNTSALQKKINTAKSNRSSSGAKKAASNSKK